MSKSLYISVIIFSAFFAQTTNAAFINILNDHTEAYAQVTYDPGVISDPGTTLDTFSGALFPSATFSGYELIGDRTATIFFPSTGFSDSTYYSAYNAAYKNIDSFYHFSVNLGSSAASQLGATGNASAETKLSLTFKVTDGNSLMDLYAAYEGNAPVELSLFDETLGVYIENLDPNTWGVETAYDVLLEENHIYTLTGSLYAFTAFTGDPSSNFGFKFDDDLVVANVPEPATFILFGVGLAGLGFCRRYKI